MSSRKASLTELKRLRKEGGTNFAAAALDDTVMEADAVEDAGGESGSDYGAAEDLRDFIEDAPEPRMTGGRLPTKRDLPQHRPLASFFKKPGNWGGRAEAAGPEAPGKGDAYFQSLLLQMDDEEPSSSEPEPEEPAAAEAALASAADELAPPNLPSELFAPFDPHILNAEAVRQLEDEDWDAPFGELGAAAAGPAAPLAAGGADDGPTENSEPAETNVGLVEAGAEPAMPRVGLDYRPPEDGCVDFYWFDAYERAPGGLVYLFGKVPDGQGGFASCCVTVHGIQRNVYFLPREHALGSQEEVTLGAVQAEVAQVLAQHGVSRFGCKRVTRKYAFELPDIPAEADWIKVVYGAGGPQLPAGLAGRTFSHVLGSNTSALELLLVKRRMMGPGWLRIRPSSTAKQNISWCRQEMEVANPKADIQVIQNGPEAPPLTVMSLSLRTWLNGQHQHEIVAASALVFNQVAPDGLGSGDRTKCNAMFTVTRDPEGLGFPARFVETLGRLHPTRLEVARNERALLGFLISMVHRHDPDVLVGHNFVGFDLGVLLHRMRAHKVEFWSRLGRLNWSAWPKAKAGSTEASFAEKQVVSGRLICDTWLAAKDLVKAKNYSLQHLAEQVLGEPAGSTDLAAFGDPARIAQLARAPESLARLLRRTELDAYQQAMLMFRLMVLPLTKQLTNIAGNLWARTLAGARAERNEYLLLHEFHDAKYILPDRQPFPAKAQQAAAADDDEPDEPKKGGRRKPAYAGGLVLEPRRGFYDKIVLLLDFNSLYPSIIQEYNICFTTVVRDPGNTDDALPDLPDPGERQGVLPRVLKGLVERRAAVKRNMKDPKTPAHLLAQYNIRQQALKLTANSMYGCLGFSHSRFYAKALAMLITARGREILQSTVHLAQQQCHLDVVYGDTDSIMIHTGVTDPAQARRLAAQVKRAVNERYRLLEIELDGVFEKLLLLRKKKYAALVLEERVNPATGAVELLRKLETKGLDMVRRDWCPLAAEASDYVLQQMMFGGGSADEIVARIHAHLGELAAKVAAGQVPLDAYVISKNLTKDPEAYADAKSQPHVVVAMRMRQRGCAARAGDTIPYVICTEPPAGGGALSERAFHVDEVRANPALAVDGAWYLAQQIHPPVSRLCECVEGTDTARLATCLGLDARKYAAQAATAAAEDGDGARLMAFLSDEEKYRDVQRLVVVCPACRASTEVAAPTRLDADGAVVSAFACAACSAPFAPATVYYQTLALIRRCLDEYHQGVQVCDECHTQTRRMRVYEARCVAETCRGSMRPRIPGSQVYHQLLYLRSIFDMDKARGRLQKDLDEDGLLVVRRLATELEGVRAMVAHQLNQCAYPIVNLREVFSFMAK